MVTNMARKPKPDPEVEEAEEAAAQQDAEDDAAAAEDAELKDDPATFALAQGSDTAPEIISEEEGLFTFVGDPRDDYSGPSELMVKGLHFVKGEPRKVPAGKVAQMLRRHDHFAEGEKKRPRIKRRGDVAQLRNELRMRKIKFDRHDGVAELKRLLGHR